MADTPDPRIRVRRAPQRGHYDRATIDAILDAGLVAHVGFVVDDRPVVIPLAYARDGDRLLFHGSPASGMMRAARGGEQPVCATVTHLDGLVVARSAFHCSMNYRSVVVHGTATEVVDLDERRRALDLITEHLLPGHLATVRSHHDSEVRATTVIEVRLDLASAKIRTGGPVDEPEDVAAGGWAGVVPLEVRSGEPRPDEFVPAGAEEPPHVRALRTARPD